MKRIVVCRHAKPLSEGFAEDDLRPLSEEGIIIQRLVTEEIKKKGIKATAIITSPLLRAVQTAEVIGQVYNLPVEEENALGNAFDAYYLLARIEEMEDDTTLFLVGHAPTTTDFVHQLIGEEVIPDGISKSGAVVIDFLDDEIAFGSGTLFGYFHL